MAPITDKHKVSREKLAYIVDSTEVLWEKDSDAFSANSSSLNNHVTHQFCWWVTAVQSSSQIVHQQFGSGVSSSKNCINWLKAEICSFVKSL
jgi:hypothetical protein